MNLTKKKITKEDGKISQAPKTPEHLKTEGERGITNKKDSK